MELGIQLAPRDERAPGFEWRRVAPVVVLAALGLVALIVWPVGPQSPSREPLDVGTRIGALLLGLSPAVALWIGYRQTMQTSVEPYGAWAWSRSRRYRIGSRKLSAAFLGVAVVFRWHAIANGDVGWALAPTVMFEGTLLLSIEGQRVLRRRLDPEAWTDELLDAYRVRVDRVALGVAWLIGWVLAAAVIPGGEELGTIQILCGYTVLVTVGLYEGVVFRPAADGVKLLSCIAGAWLFFSSYVANTASESVQLGYALAGAPLMIVLLERARRRAVRERWRQLERTGFGDEARARYRVDGSPAAAAPAASPAI